MLLLCKYSFLGASKQSKVLRFVIKETKKEKSKTKQSDTVTKELIPIEGKVKIFTEQDATKID